MTTATFLLGIVLALVAGAGLALAFFHLKSAAQNAAKETAQQAVIEAGQPVADTLARLETHIRDLEAQRQQAMGGLQHHLTALNRETVALSHALRSPNARGRWGELTLRRVAELSGMASLCDFYEQESGGGMRPDMIVRLPGERTLAVDAKAPLAAYLDAEAATDDAQRRAALDRHAQQLARHVSQLSTREYWAQLQPAPEMVVLFLAGEHFLSAALDREPELLDRALAKKVFIATPVTLVSVLKGVAYGWRQERLAANAEELRRIAGEFYDRMRVFVEAYSESGRQLAKAVDAYNRSVGSWETRLEPSLKRMKELGVGGAAEAQTPPRVDAAVRQTGESEARRRLDQ